MYRRLPHIRPVFASLAKQTRAPIAIYLNLLTTHYSLLTTYYSTTYYFVQARARGDLPQPAAERQRERRGARRAVRAAALPRRPSSPHVLHSTYYYFIFTPSRGYALPPFLADFPSVSVQWVERDVGPATKLLPTLQVVKSRQQ